MPSSKCREVFPLFSYSAAPCTGIIYTRRQKAGKEKLEISQEEGREGESGRWEKETNHTTYMIWVLKSKSLTHQAPDWITWHGLRGTVYVAWSPSDSALGSWSLRARKSLLLIILFCRMSVSLDWHSSGDDSHLVTFFMGATKCTFK